uniref:Uncharacterized protein n=1 Tax=Polytomella parva TaxID=51329 RepID=A0A7S0YJM7_9CHLO
MGLFEDFVELPKAQQDGIKEFIKLLKKHSTLNPPEPFSIDKAVEFITLAFKNLTLSPKIEDEKFDPDAIPEDIEEIKKFIKDCPLIGGKNGPMFNVNYYTQQFSGYNVYTWVQTNMYGMTSAKAIRKKWNVFKKTQVSRYNLLQEQTKENIKAEYTLYHRDKHLRVGIPDGPLKDDMVNIPISAWKGKYEATFDIIFPPNNRITPTN